MNWQESSPEPIHNGDKADIRGSAGSLPVDGSVIADRIIDEFLGLRLYARFPS